jgi:hybrid cluster-associated redox disulfide protein
MTTKPVKVKVSKKPTENTFINKKDLIGDIVSNYPETIPVLAQAGLHCIGCHVSVSESLEEGCLAHGLNEKGIDKLVLDSNKRIKEFENAPKVIFSDGAVKELIKKLKATGARYVKIVNSFGGEFDFETTNEISDDEVIIKAKDGKGFIEILIFSKIERMLRGIEIDYDSKLKDFVAKRK